MLRLPPLEFNAPTKLSEAVAAYSNGGARLVAGGTDLWPNMKRRHQRAEAVVSLMSIDELRRIEQHSQGVTIGSTVTLTGVLRDPVVRDRYPGFARAVAAISSPPLRNMGTLGGNLCVDTRCTYYNQTEEWRRSIDYCMKEQGSICWVATKSPRCWAHSASDAAPMLCALGARIKLISSEGEREIPLTALYRDDGIDYLGMRPGEILTQVIVPRRCRPGALPLGVLEAPPQGFHRLFRAVGGRRAMDGREQCGRPRGCLSRRRGFQPRGRQCRGRIAGGQTAR